MAKPEPITAEEFDRKFDAGEDVSAHLDWSTARRPGLEVRHIDVHLTTHLLDLVDQEAERQGISRDALISRWLEERLRAAA